MQAFQKLLIKNNLKLNFYKNKIALFSDWTSNSWTGEAVTRHVRMSYGKVNGFAVYTRPHPKNKQGVQLHSHKPNYEQKSDFPELSSQIQFLSKKKK